MIKKLKSMYDFKNIVPKVIARSQINSTFVSTVPVLLPVRTAYRSFYKDSFLINDNTPSMPLSDAHLGGFFVLQLTDNQDSINERVQPTKYKNQPVG